MNPSDLVQSKMESLDIQRVYPKLKKYVSGFIKNGDGGRFEFRLKQNSNLNVILTPDGNKFYLSINQTQIDTDAHAWTTKYLHNLGTIVRMLNIVATTVEKNNKWYVNKEKWHRKAPPKSKHSGFRVGDHLNISYEKGVPFGIPWDGIVVEIRKNQMVVTGKGDMYYHRLIDIESKGTIIKNERTGRVYR